MNCIRTAALALAIVGGLFHTPSARAEVCYQAMECGRCVLGRADVRVGGIDCAVCMNFCVPLLTGADVGKPLLQNSDVKALQATQVDPYEKVFYISTPDSFIRSIAAVNPEAAELLSVMNARSQSTPNQMPTNGYATARKLTSAEAVTLSLTPGASADAVAALLTDVPGSPNQYSKATWRLTIRPSSAHVDLTHRIVDAADREVASLYPDIRVTVRWIDTGAGAGFWQTTAWEPVHER